MKERWQCNSCESKCVLTSEIDQSNGPWPDGYLDGELCEGSEWTKIKQPQTHETVDQWEKRTGKTYPDDGPVYAWMEFTKDKWCLAYYGDAKRSGVSQEKKIIIATELGKPPQDWWPE